MSQASNILFLAEYTLVGDINPREWIDAKLADAVSDGRIYNRRVVHVFDGIMTSTVLFEFETSVVIPETEDSHWTDQYDLAKKEGKIIADSIVNDSDTKIRNLRIEL